MNILPQIGIVFLLVAVSDMISRLLPIALPVSIIGILLLLGLLLSNALKLAHIEDIGDFFLKNMGFFFIAAGVSILGKYHLLEEILWQFALIVLFTTLLTFAVTGYAVKYAMRLQNTWRKNDKNDTNI